MADKKREEFVVQDRRKFTSEGDLRSDATVAEEEKAPVPANEAPKPANKVAEMPTPPPQVTGESQSEIPDAPSAEEQHTQHEGYKAAGNKINDLINQQGGKLPADHEATFEKLVVSLYMQAMMQMGMIREENAPPRADIIGARHTIDMIGILGEKTKGNLTDRETRVLQNCLFELRMAFMEITNVITNPPPQAPKK